MQALVTGGNGFIGSHLVDRLIRDRWKVVSLDPCRRRYDAMPPQARFIQGSLGQASLVREALTGVDVVFHLAWTTIHESANRDPVADIQANLILTLHLLNACRQAKAGKIVFVSSGGTIYGPPEVLPMPETHPQNPITAYGISKLAAEKYLHMFGHLYDLDYVILRPSVAYGPRQNPRGRQGAVTVFLYRVARGLPLTIWGDGHTIRDYLYISDLIDALTAAATGSSQTRIFNVGGAEGISLIQLVRLAETTVGRQAIVEYQPARGFDAQTIVLDTGLARRELGWRPRVLLAEGLARTWAWLSTLEE